MLSSLLGLAIVGLIAIVVALVAVPRSRAAAARAREPSRDGVAGADPSDAARADPSDAAKADPSDAAMGDSADAKTMRGDELRFTMYWPDVQRRPP
jgi:hypothetical protein